MIDQIIKKAVEEKRNLLEPEAKEILRELKMPVLPQGVAKSPEEASCMAEKMGFPVVMKIVSPDIIHKTDAKGVKLNIRTKDEAKATYEEIVSNALSYKKDARIEGVLVTPMAQSGTEVIVGMVRDPQFGPTIMFGLGGIFVEVFKDVTFRAAPISLLDAREMVEEIKGYALLKGIRGEASKDIDCIIDILAKVSKLSLDYPEIKEIDLNPVLVYGEGAAVIDARIIF